MRIDRIGRPALVVLFLLSILALALLGGSGAPSGVKEVQLLRGPSGPTLAFAGADFALSSSRTIPTSGWRPGTMPFFKFLQEAKRQGVNPPTVWARFKFDRKMLGKGGIALFGDMIRENFVVQVNGAELYRSRMDDSDPGFGWNHPQFLPLPPAMLRDGVNDIAIRIDTTSPRLLGIGSIRIGPDRDIRATFNNRYFLSNTAPAIVSGYLLILTIGAMFFWMKRPDERVYGWLVLLGLVWMFRNLHYFAQEPPFYPALFWSMTTDCIFILVIVTFGFASSYFELHATRSTRLLVAMAGIGLVFRHILVAFDGSELPSFLLTFPLLASMVFLTIRASQRRPSAANWLMCAAITLAILFAIHDMLLSYNILSGTGIFLLPYGGLLIFATFDATLTNRLQKALINVEDVNLTLESRVAEVTASLVQSEEARAELQVALAIDVERERIMREIHDGIGSSLLAALTTAKHRNESPETIATLARSLTDLRIGVDSLEPVGGDVVALLANLRHRMERELKGAGIAFVWKVDAAPLLSWLDPIGALHILRILQEAIGNVLLHSGARQIEVRCAARDHEGVPGVLIEIADSGKGFDSALPSRGKGLANMAARAEALNAIFRTDSAVGKGTVSAIWLPLTQRASP